MIQRGAALENNELEYIVVGEFGSAAATHVSEQRGVKLSRATAAADLDFPCSIASHKPARHSPRALNFEAEGGFGERRTTREELQKHWPSCLVGLVEEEEGLLKVVTSR